MADLTLLDQTFATIGGAVSTTVATMAAAARRLVRRLDRLEERLRDLESNTALTSQSLSRAAAAVDQRIASVESSAQRASAAVTETQSLKAALEAGLQSVRREVEQLRKEAEKASSLAAEATTRDDFAAHVADEAARWSEVNRTLGQIEGMLSAVRDRMREK